MPRDAAKRIAMAAGMLHGTCVGKKAGAQNIAFFSGKVAAAGDKGQLDIIHRIGVAASRLR